jgi:surface carbohydrate biosynthesis protein (TIGR04326 family)
MSKLGKGTCVISPSSKRSVKKILKKMKGRKFKWVYLGDDVSRAILTDEMMHDSGQRVETAEMLQETAKSLRQSYTDYIGKLSLKKDSMMWWASSVSEKSPYRSKAFLHVCYLKICTDILKKYPDEPIVFFVQEKAVRQAILENMPIDNLEHIKDTRESIRGTLKDLKDFILYKGWFLLSNIYRIAIAKYVYRMQKRVGSQRPSTLIHTWVDWRSFDQKGAYRESYFGELPNYLEKSDENVIIVPHVLGTVPYRKTVDNMAKSEHNFLVPHAFLSIRDVISVFYITSANKPKKIRYPKFENMDISWIIYEDLKNDWIGAYVAFDLLLYRFVRRLKEKRVPVDTVIYLYENQIWEKVLCAAMRKFYPSAYLIGYQHSAISRMYLNYFFSKRELGIMPFPDKIVANGRYTKDVFVESGYPREKVVQGGAVRYAYLLGPKMVMGRRKKGKPVILVTPSISKFDAMELIWKIFKAFEHRDEYKILIKCHPTMPFEKISGHLNIKLPKHFTVSNKPVVELLSESDVLLYTYSTTCVEAIAAGVPALHVRSDLMIDLDPLDFNPGARLSARNPEEIVKRVEEAIAMDEKELSKKRKMWNSVVKDLFGRVDDSTYRLFSR